MLMLHNLQRGSNLHNLTVLYTLQSTMSIELKRKTKNMDRKWK